MKRSFTIAPLVVVLSFCASSQPALGQSKRLLVVHSYHKTQEGHVVKMSEGIEEALKGIDVQIDNFYMDTKRRNSLEWKQEAGHLAAAKADEFKPDVIITMDDNAQQYFAMDYAKRQGAPPIVFGGVNADAAKYGFPTENVTGVLERPNVEESFDLLLKIVPTVKKVVIISDKSPTTDAFHAYCKTLTLPVEVIAHEQPETFDQWKKTILKYQDSADAFGVYVIRTIKRSETDDTTVPETELASWLTEHNKLPTVGFFDNAAKVGLMCGISVSMKEQGFAAAMIAKGILKGQKPNEFPVVPTKNGRILLNLKTAESFGVNVDYNIIRNAKEVIK